MAHRPAVSLMSRLLEGKNPADLLQEILTELETSSDLTPKRRRALLRIGSLLLHVEAKRIQALENGGPAQASNAVLDATFDLFRSRALAKILDERHHRLRFSFTRPAQPPVVPVAPPPEKEPPPPTADTIDLVRVFQRILDRARARDASLSL